MAGLSRPFSAKPARNATPGISMAEIPKLQLGKANEVRQNTNEEMSDMRSG
jgi:hypothetical protein